MSKIICDICGTTYPDTAEQCPICGCSRDAAAEMLGDDLLLEEIIDEPKGKGGRFSTKKKKEIFDFDEVNADPDAEVEEENPFDEEAPYEESQSPNTLVVILLTVLIAALLFAAGFLFVRYFLPNMDGGKTLVSTQPQAEQTTGIPAQTGVPCEMMALTSGKEAVLSEIGGKFLLHVTTVPADTTDPIIFTSTDESIATVTDDGRIEAVGEGETIIEITCGVQRVEFQVIVKIEEETVPPTTAAVVAETSPEAVQTAAEATTATVKPDVVLKLKKTDIMLGVYYEYQLLLDCNLEQNQVEWSSEHPHIATVDENGVVKAVKSGTTAITAKYGDQEVKCIVRCG